MQPYRSSYAVDKDGTDQVITGTDSTLLTAARVLWDFNEDFSLEASAFIAPVDGIWGANGTIKCASLVGCTKVALEIWRNDALWFTVAEHVVPVGETAASLVYSCDMDCYYTNSHVFDLRIRLEGVSPTCTVSGSEDDTAWGASFLFPLDQVSPTG